MKDDIEDVGLPEDPVDYSEVVDDDVLADDDDDEEEDDARSWKR